MISTKYFPRIAFFLIAWPVFTNTYAINIGNLVRTSNDTISVALTQLDGANYLDVAVDISGNNAQYDLSQSNDDTVLVSFKSGALPDISALIKVDVTSNRGAAMRMFSYLPAELDISSPIVSTQEALATLAEKPDDPKENSTIVLPARESVDPVSRSSYNQSGLLEILIVGNNTSIGDAARKLAESNGLELLIMPGDDDLLSEKITQPVSTLDDLFAASNKMVRRIVIDRNMGAMRLIGSTNKPVMQNVVQPKDSNSEETGDKDDFVDTDNAADEEEVSDTEDSGNVLVSWLIDQYATSTGLSLFSLPGDDALLDMLVADTVIASQQDLATFASSIGAIIDIDTTNKLIRLRQNNDI